MQTAGPPASVLTDEVIREAFGVRALAGAHPLTRRLSVQVAPLSEHEPRKDPLIDG